MSLGPVLLLFPPGKSYQRGENRSQGNVFASTATSIRACNDLGYCAAMLEKEGFIAIIRDYQTERTSFTDIEKELMDIKPSIVMMSVTTGTILNDLVFASFVKEITNSIMILKGAMFHNITLDQLSKLNLTTADILIGNEEELAITRIANLKLNNIGSADKIPNIIYRDENGNYKKNEVLSEIHDLDSLPFPARHLMNNKLYVRPDTNEAMATIQTSRGCSQSCIYCLSPILSGKRIFFRSPHNIMDELIQCYEKHNIRNFFFRADTFTINSKWVQELCTLIISSKLHGKIQFTANSRVFPLEKETLKIMKQAGCFAIAFGFETGSMETMKKIKKGSTIEQNIRAAAWAKELRILIYGFFIIGFPWESKEHLLETYNHIFSLNADFIEIHIALPYNNTPLYDICYSANTIEQDVFGFDYYNSSITGTNFLSLIELIEFKNKTILSFYFRPRYILKRFIECIHYPRKFITYAKYAFRIITKIIGFS